jgi:hypothetical protein
MKGITKKKEIIKQEKGIMKGITKKKEITKEEKGITKKNHNIEDIIDIIRWLII